MSPRDTRTGDVLEQMILPALTRGGYEYEKRVNVGRRPGGGRHFIDVLAKKDGKRWLVSLKWQQTGGTAEQKIPFEVISLLEILESADYDGAYLVLGGAGWTLRDYYVGGGLTKHLADAEKIRIMTLEAFVALANGGGL